MWTNQNRSRYDRSKLRYPSDVTDEEWALIAPLIPPAKRGGNKCTLIPAGNRQRTHASLSMGCQWASLLKALPPRSTVNDYFRRWDYDGTLDRIHHALYVKCRNWPGERSTRPPRSSTARASKAQRKGAHRPIRLRCGQEHQRQETPCPGRHARFVAVRHHPRRRHPIPRRRRDAHQRAVRHVSVSAQTLCRQRLSGTEIPTGI